METNTKVNSKMILEMVKVFILLQVVANTRDNTRMINVMVKVF